WYLNPASQDTRNLDVIASFDISNPRALAPVDRVEFPASGWETHANITQDRVIVSQSAWGSNGPTTQFYVIDIADPGGGLHQAAQFAAAGRVQDRWSMDFSGGIFRAVFQMRWNGGARLQTWSMTTPASVHELGGLNIQVPESMTGAGFDERYAYIVTARAFDPLWVVDTQDPSQPRIPRELSMPGQLPFLVPQR